MDSGRSVILRRIDDIVCSLACCPCTLKVVAVIDSTSNALDEFVISLDDYARVVRTRSARENLVWQQVFDTIASLRRPAAATSGCLSALVALRVARYLDTYVDVGGRTFRGRVVPVIEDVLQKVVRGLRRLRLVVPDARSMAATSPSRQVHGSCITDRVLPCSCDGHAPCRAAKNLVTLIERSGLLADAVRRADQSRMTESLDVLPFCDEQSGRTICACLRERCTLVERVGCSCDKSTVINGIGVLCDASAVAGGEFHVPTWMAGSSSGGASPLLAHVVPLMVFLTDIALSSLNFVEQTAFVEQVFAAVPTQCFVIVRDSIASTSEAIEMVLGMAARFDVGVIGCVPSASMAAIVTDALDAMTWPSAATWLRARRAPLAPASSPESASTVAVSIAALPGMNEDFQFSSNRSDTKRPTKGSCVVVFHAPPTAIHCTVVTCGMTTLQVQLLRECFDRCVANVAAAMGSPLCPGGGFFVQCCYIVGTKLARRLLQGGHTLAHCVVDGLADACRAYLTSVQSSFEPVSGGYACTTDVDCAEAWNQFGDEILLEEASGSGDTNVNLVGDWTARFTMSTCIPRPPFHNFVGDDRGECATILLADVPHLTAIAAAMESIRAGAQLAGALLSTATARAVQPPEGWFRGRDGEDGLGAYYSLPGLAELVVT